CSCYCFFFFKQKTAYEIAFAGFKHGIGSGCAGHSLLRIPKLIFLTLAGRDEAGLVLGRGKPRLPYVLRRFPHGRRWFGNCGLAGCTSTMDFDVRDLDGTERAFAVSCHTSNFLDQFDGGIIALAEDGVLAIEAGIGNFSDEKLRAVGVGSGVGVGETPGPIESDGGRSLILEFVARIACAIAFGISALNHETGNHAVKDGAVIKWNAVLLGVGDG